MMYLTLFCTVTLFFYALSQAWTERRKQVNRRLALFTGIEKENGRESREGKRSRLLSKFTFPIWKKLKRLFKRKISGRKSERLEKKLLQAGNPHGMNPVEFRFIQICIFLICALVLGGYSFLESENAGRIFLFILFSMGAAVILPNYYLKIKIKERSKQAKKELPDSLDLLTVSLEAGLGFDSALAKLTSKRDGVLMDEFRRCLEEIRLGKPRREALQGIKERLQVEEVSVLISSIIQAEKLGIGLVQVLRIQSQEVREQRRQRAEEEAMKAPVKILFPLVLFIFPSLFIILLGPAAIQFITTFKK